MTVKDQKKVKCQKQLAGNEDSALQARKLKGSAMIYKAVKNSSFNIFSSVSVI